MKITYISHSGFAVELENPYFFCLIITKGRYQSLIRKNV